MFFVIFYKCYAELNLNIKYKNCLHQN